MRLLGGRGGVLLAVLAAWTALAIVVVTTTTWSQVDDTIEYNRMTTVSYDGLGRAVVQNWSGRSDPQLLVGTVFILTGCVWLPVTLALLIAALAMWARRG